MVYSDRALLSQATLGGLYAPPPIEVRRRNEGYIATKVLGIA